MACNLSSHSLGTFKHAVHLTTLARKTYGNYAEHQNHLNSIISKTNRAGIATSTTTVWSVLI